MLLLALAACGPIKGQLEDHEERITAAEGQLSGGDPADLTTRLAALEATVGAQQATIEAQAATITTLEAALAEQATQLGAVEEDLATQGSELDTLSSGLDLEAAERLAADEASAVLIDDHEARIAGLEGDHVGASTHAALDSRVAAVEADYLVAADYDALDDRVSDLETGVDDFTSLFVMSDTTITVTDCADLLSELDTLGAGWIAPTATVTLQLSLGSSGASAATWSCADGVSIDSPLFANVEIVGDTSDPAVYTLSFTGVPAVAVSEGGALGGIRGVTLDVNGASGIVASEGGVIGEVDAVVLYGDGTSDTYGVFAVDSGVVEVGEITVDGFYYGLLAQYGGLITNEGSASSYITLTDNTYAGAGAWQGGILKAPYAAASGHKYASFQASYGGMLFARSSSASSSSSTYYYSYVASLGAVMDVQGSTSTAQIASQTANPGGAFTANDGSVMMADGAVDQSNTWRSFTAWGHSYMSIQGADCLGSGASTYGAYTQGLSVIHSNSGTVGCGYTPSRVEEKYTSSATGKNLSW